jgi:hypothetical protein
MDPALTPYGPETARYTVPYRLLQAGTYNRALSIEPERLYVTGHNNPALGTCTGTDKYINSTNLCKNMTDDEKGEYYSLNTKRWNLLEIDRKTDSRGRIHVNEINYGKEIRVFVSDIEQEPETCKSYKLLPYSIFTEVRKSRIKDQAGEPVKVQSSGDVWLGAGNKDKYVKVFVRK